MHATVRFKRFSRQVDFVVELLFPGQFVLLQNIKFGYATQMCSENGTFLRIFGKIIVSENVYYCHT